MLTSSLGVRTPLDLCDKCLALCEPRLGEGLESETSSHPPPCLSADNFAIVPCKKTCLRSAPKTKPGVLLGGVAEQLTPATWWC